MDTKLVQDNEDGSGHYEFKGADGQWYLSETEAGAATGGNSTGTGGGDKGGTDTVTGGGGTTTVTGGGGVDAKDAAHGFKGNDGKWYSNATDANEAVSTVANPTTSNSYWEDLAKRYIKEGKWDLAQIAKDGLSVAAVQWAYENAKNPPKTGYQGGIPTLTAERSQVAAQDPNVRPGAGGHQYFTQTGYADPKDAMGLAALRTNIANQKTAIEAQNKLNDTTLLARQRVANAANVIDPNTFFGRVANVPMTAAEKVKLPTATTAITPAAQFVPDTSTAGHITPADPYTPPPFVNTDTTKAQSKWTTEQVASFIRDQHLTSDRATIDKAAAAADAPKWQVDDALKLLSSGNLGGVNAASKAYQDAITGSPEEVRQGNVNRDVLLGYGITPYTDPTTKAAVVDAYGYMSGLVNSGQTNAAQAFYKQKQADLGFTDRDFLNILGTDANFGGQGNALTADALNAFKAAPVAQQQAAAPTGIAAIQQAAPTAPIAQQAAAPAVEAPVLSNAPSVMDQVAAWTPPAQERQFSTTGGTMAGAQSYGLGQLQSILRDQAAQGFTPQQLIGAAGSGYGLNEADVRSIGQSIGLQGYAQGGLMGLAQGGQPHAPRYLQGNTDGMADKIPARIDGQQEAALAHGEFVVPADVVSHLGNGNSDAGADVLYKMMDKIRKARTGTKKQGKQIDPNKFTPGGLAFAAGGQVLHFAGTTGSAVPAGTVGVEENLSTWAGPYVTNMLGKGEALSNAPYQAYQGPLTAGDSALQTQGFQNAANLQTPTSIGTAANTAGNVATNFNSLANAGYPSSQATNQFTVPGNYESMAGQNQFTVPGAYQPAQNTNAFTTPTTTGYTAAPDITSQKFTDTGVASSYMNPYLQQSLDPQLQEARRQSQITQQANNAQATQAGAFGGARQGILAAENQRNLGSNLANITGQGYNTAYTTGQNQFNADQGRSMTAQQANQAAANQAAQFGASQNMTAAQLAAQYGLSAQQANEASRQYAANYGMTGAQQAAQYGQAAQAANEQSRQFGANFGMQGAQNAAQYGQAAQAQNEASNQFGAGYGLQALQGQLSAAQTQGGLGATQNAAGLANLQAMLNAGGTQQATQQAGIVADQAAFNAERDNPYKMVQYQQSLLQGLPISAQQYNISTNPYLAGAATLGDATKAVG